MWPVIVYSAFIHDHIVYILVVIPTLGSIGPHWGPVELMCLSVLYVSVCFYMCLYVCLSVWSSASLFGDHSCGS